MLLLVLGSMVWSQVHRYRRISGPVERQQTKWVIFGLTIAILSFLGFGLPEVFFPELGQPDAAGLLYDLVSGTMGVFAFLLVPISIAFAILRHRLSDIDILINRALVYGGLTASVVGLYVLVVGGLGALLQACGNLLVSLLAAGLVAVLFAPLRDRLQRGVNRLMYGERDEPYRALSRLGERLESALAPDAILHGVVETVARALKLPYAAVALKRGDGFETAAENGSPVGKLTVLPLVSQGETVGQLLVSPRSPREPLNPADRRLLDDLARQAGVAAQAVRLTADLQRSNQSLQGVRERLVTAREEERRRLRRDLHDGLGPQLAALTLKLETARNRLGSDPLAETLLAELTQRTQAAVADIRRLVYALRPPALDELGLVSALAEQAAQYSQNGLSVSVEAPEQLPPLPAAVEVAAYRIVQEALTNVVRHARANACVLRIALDETAGVLCPDVWDDGHGLPSTLRQGVGLQSMRERAEELGGMCTVENMPAGGVRVRALLPCRVCGMASVGEEER